MLDPISDADWPEALDHLRGGYTGSANVYRTMAHHPALLAAWQNLRTHIVTESALPKEALEVVTLRTGHRLGATYEWAHHIVRARAAGFDDARIASIAGAPETMAPGDAALSRAVDALIDNAVLSGELQKTISDAYGVSGMMDLIATVGFYATLAFIVKSFETPIDADVAEALDREPFAP